MNVEAVAGELKQCGVRWQLDRDMLQLHEYTPELSKVGLRAWVEPYGVYCAFMVPPTSGELWFYFDTDSGALAKVLWFRPYEFSRGLHEPVDVAIAEQKP